MRFPLPVAVALVGLSALGACGSGPSPGDQRAEQARAAAIEAGLDDDVADFLALAVRGQTATYQVTFPGPTPGTTLVVANRPPDRRVDLLEGDVVTEVRLVLDGEAFECPRDAEADRIGTCTRTDALVEAPGLLPPQALEELTSSLRERQDDFSFRVERSPIAGVQAHCLVTERKPGRERPDVGERGEICVSPEGALLRVDQDGESLEAIDYRTDVPDDTFARPDAPPQGAQG